MLLSSILGSCRSESSGGGSKDPLAGLLVGAWRTQVQFSGGALASVHDLEFMYVFNSGGTMTESSNYDAAPPVPPAYGIWRYTSHNQFEAKYEFYVTKPPSTLDEIKQGSGWLPAGRGILTEKITLSADANSYTSTIKLEMFDINGKAAEGGGGDAEGHGVRMKF